MARLLRGDIHWADLNPVIEMEPAAPGSFLLRGIANQTMLHR
jgi:hypothetical protein